MTPDIANQQLPQHIAIIMDGNGRWAKQRHLPRTMGHKKGAEVLEQVVRDAAKLGVRYLSVFAFSTENWQRPLSEVNDLMGLMSLYLKSKTAELHKNNVRLKVMGDKTRLSTDLQALITQAEDLTANNTGLTIVPAVSYSGRWDITQATQKLAQLVQQGQLSPADITEDMLQAQLYLADLPAPDLLIRTSGEQRISNFMLWQTAYSELYFCPKLWPDFGQADMLAAIESYQQRQRRFGQIEEQLTNDPTSLAATSTHS